MFTKIKIKMKIAKLNLQIYKYYRNREKAIKKAWIEEIKALATF